MIGSFTGYFDRAWLLPAAILLPALVVWMLARAQRRRRDRLAKLGDLEVVKRLVPPATLAPTRWRAVRLGLAAALAAVAAAGPRWGAERSIIRASGIDMVFALDASLSMMVPDERPNRLGRLKQEVRRIRALSRGDRVGLIAFAGRSYILTPLTVDDGALDLYLDNLDPSVVGQAGSSLARTIRQGTDLLLLTRTGADRALVVMSDGEAFETVEEVVAEARRAGERGISLVTVGFGTPEGGTITTRGPNGEPVVKRDDQGRVVVSRYSPTHLQAAAEAANGTFIPADATDKAARVKQALATLRQQQRTTAAGETRTPRFQLFLIPAIVLLLLDTLLSERRGRRRRLAAAAETAPAAAAALMVTLLAGCAGDSPVEAGNTAYRLRQYGRAAALYREAIESGDRRPEVAYNYGTALLAQDSLAQAAEVLERVADAKDEELRYRALFNLGLAHLKAGLAAPEQLRDGPLDAALAAYKRVLLMRWADQDAKWNYELALRERQSGGGGGGGGQSQSDAQDGGQDEDQPEPRGGLAQRQAEQLLGSAAREERDVQSRRQRQNRAEPPPGGKDW